MRFNLVLWSYTYHQSDKASDKNQLKLSDLRLWIDDRVQSDIRDASKRIWMMRQFQSRPGGLEALARLELICGPYDSEVEDDISDLMLVCFKEGLRFAVSDPKLARQLLTNE